MIRNNAHIYSVSATVFLYRVIAGTMCDVLQIPKSTYYYHANSHGRRVLKMEDKEISQEISRIFKESRNNYGTRKIKKELSRLSQPKHVSRRRISRLMNELGLVSNYTVAPSTSRIRHRVMRR
ncbi:hypothetical protein Pryu01_02075 [Paraliobacillus ryukyuensis]|uniref:Helix-turn-helix protein n=1 Tax=Paraliobacillus ryukyuensis TaxID=200904 RepID=A0A366E4F1_9BACI|nr:helix-turn-helix protein [Paraliobacillus ryukyuensis]